MATINIQIENRKALSMLSKIEQQMEDTTPLFKSISETLANETEWNFQQQGRPRWLPLADSTKAKRLRNNNGSNMLMILQESGLLAASITPAYGPSWAAVGSNLPYAPVHQLGGTIHHPERTSITRLAENKNGALKRQRSNSNLAVFARRDHKAREMPSQTKAYDVEIPARPYLPFFGKGQSARLQPEAEQSVLQTIGGYLMAGFR